MEPVKASSTPALQATNASKRTTTSTDVEAEAKAKREALAAKKPEEQAPPRATINTRGEKVGQLLNVTA